MLFSNEQVAGFIGACFEPVWQSVRPVPIVRIDFGDGHVLTRTLHGNIATYVCTADGQVLDVLPGIYTRSAYVAQLDQLRLLARYVDQEGKERRAARLREYHQAHADALARNQLPPRLARQAPMTKAAIERSIKVVLMPARNRPVAQPVGAGNVKPGLEDPEDVATWRVLAEDTRVNERARRLQIHGMLAAAGTVRPADICQRLYKEVLHADLDDPYLGLGPTLFASYPFRAED